MKKKLFLIILLLMITFKSVLADSDSITEGRLVLFNNGNPTCSGIIEAENHFRSAVLYAPANQEANFFYALTKFLAFGLETGQEEELETLLDLFEAFGITRTANDDLLNEPIYTAPPESAGNYLPPSTIPEAGFISQFLNASFLTRLDDILANLSKIDRTFKIMITQIETGEDAVEIDYGDILLLKGGVNTLKGLILTICAYNLDEIDTSELIELAQTDSFRIQRDLLDNYPNALKLISNGASQLTDAKSALVSAIDLYEEALNFIIDETDNQNDDLFSLNEEDLNELQEALGYLVEVRDSLDENRPVEFIVDDRVERYDFNALFGNTYKEPMDIRDSLPQFNMANKPINKTFPGPYLFNGFLPDSIEFYEWITTAPSLSSIEWIQKAYVAYYGRPGDVGGVEYWADRLDAAGGNLDSIIDAFGTSQEFTEQYGFLSDNQLIDTIYQQMFNRTPDAGGKAYYADKLSTGEMTLQTITLDILGGASGNDSSIIDNKLEFAKYFTDQLELNGLNYIDVVESKKLLESVSDLALDLATAKETLNILISN